MPSKDMDILAKEILELEANNKLSGVGTQSVILLRLSKAIEGLTEAIRGYNAQKGEFPNWMP